MSAPGTSAGHVPGWDDPGIVICTGAGISVASGLPTYRGPDGIYERDPDLATVTSADAIRTGLDELWRHWGPFRDVVAGARPNAAHLAIARFAVGRDDVTVITMNVDGLHRLAGSAMASFGNVIELHGNLRRSRCVDGCGQPDWDDPVAHVQAPACRRCGGPARPAITLFGEAPDAEPSWLAKRAVRGVTTFLAVGTSDSVSTGTRLAANARYAGARMIWVNVEPPPDPSGWHHVVLGPAEETLPALLDTLR